MSKQSDFQTARVLQDRYKPDGIRLRIDREDDSYRQSKVVIVVGAENHDDGTAKLVSAITSEVMETLGPAFQAIFAKKLAARIAKLHAEAIAELDAHQADEARRRLRERFKLATALDPAAAAKVGEDEGELCNRDGCNGVLEIPPSVNCSCHISAPCSACTSRQLCCPVCGWECTDA